MIYLYSVLAKLCKTIDIKLVEYSFKYTVFQFCAHQLYLNIRANVTLLNYFMNENLNKKEMMIEK